VEKVADDLIALEGIGPKVAKVLNTAGIVSFAELAGANPAEVQKILDAAGLQMMNPEGWIEQARLAAQGDREGLAKLQAELKGGRKK
jgi:predicted flap endonuclease-1-like 5' DNA nuclease